MNRAGAGTPSQSAARRVLEFGKRNIDVVALVLILVLALVLRLKQLGHVLSFDEAWNAVTAGAGAAGKTKDIFFFNFYRHPPIYLSAAILYRKLFSSSTGFMQAISIASSLGVIATLFFMAKKGIGRAAAVCGAFFLAVAPVANILDTWVKQDSLAILFCALFAYFFLSRRYVLSGIFFGLGLLTKEIVLFVALGALIYTIATFSRKKMIGLLEAFVIGAVMSAWWYLAFSNTKGDFLKFFFGNSPVNARFIQPWHYYLGRLPADMTWSAVIFVIVGVVVWALRRARMKKVEKGAEDYVLFSIAWAAPTLLLLTLSAGKPVWMVYSAAFPLALLAGYGLSSLLSAEVVRKELVYVVIALVLAGGVAYGVTLNHDRYMQSTGSWGETLEDHAIALKLNSMSRPGEALVMSYDDLSPEIAFYLKSYKPDSILPIPFSENARGMTTTITGREPGKNIYLVDRRFPWSLVTSYVDMLAPDLVMIKDRPNGSLSSDLARELEKIALYIEVENGRIWRGEDISRATGGAP